MRLPRRAFLHRAALAATGGLLAACRRRAPLPPPENEWRPGDAVSTDPAAAPMVERYTEAPMLAETVAHGQLPPVQERLPANPYVREANDSVGTYGGVLRRPLLQTTFDPSQPRQRTRALGLRGDPTRLAIDVLEAHALLTYDHDLRVAPHLCEWWEYDGEGEWRLHLREGLRWSDGAPFTCRDIAFALAHNPIWEGELRGVLQQTYQVVDDFDLRIRRASPDALHGLHGLTDALVLPAHYLQRYLPAFTDREALNALAIQELGWADAAPAGPDAEPWEYLWQLKADWRTNPERPTLNAWALTNSPEQDVLALRRNPCFWQVDAAGQQLPYLDEVQLVWTRRAELYGGLREGR